MLRKALLMMCVQAGIASACECLEAPVKDKLRISDVVFRGTIIALRDSGKAGRTQRPEHKDTGKIAVFRVSRVWKGEVGAIFEMPAVEETTACIGFWPPLLKVGNELLLYASRYRGTEYFTNICGEHKLARDADDFKELGPGWPPKAVKDSRQPRRPR